MKQRLNQLVNRLTGQNIMIVGDMVADVYLEGKISRISREAPVLILEYMEEVVVPGGAANAVHNAATLGGKVFAVGMIGSDQAGQQLTTILNSKKVNTEGFITDQERPTTTKTRIMAGGLATVRQQVVRIDKEAREPVAAHTETKLLEYIRLNISRMNAVVMSDYGCGTLSPAVYKTIISICNERGIPCMVDSRYNIQAFSGVTIVKQNESEAAAALGYPTIDEQTLDAAGQALLEKMQAQAVLITRGPQGMSLFERRGVVTHIPVANRSEVYDVTGAGDTVVVAMMLAVAAGADYVTAARLANIAAGVVVKKLGTATTTPAELQQAIGAFYETD